MIMLSILALRDKEGHFTIILGLFHDPRLRCKILHLRSPDNIASRDIKKKLAP